MTGYRNAVYNPRENTVDLYSWDENGTRIVSTHNFFPYFYYEDEKGEDLSIYNTKLKKKIFDSYYNKQEFLKETGMKRVFENFNPSQQFLLDMYWEHCEKDEFSKFPLKIYFVDIEAVDDGPFASPHDPTVPINVITVYNNLDKKYMVWGMGDYKNTDPDVTYYNCKTETQLLKLFLNYIREDAPDIISGWNSDRYDIPYIINRISMILGEEEAKSISPINNIYQKKFAGKFGNEEIVWRIGGVSCIDYMDIYKKFCLTNRESYRLDYIAQVELDSQKLDYSGMSLNQLRETDWQKFVAYNIHDVKLLVQLEEQLNYIELLRRLAYMGCASFEAALGTVSVVAGAAAIKARTKGKRLSTFQKPDSGILPGAYVAEPISAHHKYIVNFDANSLYPNLMITLNMSLETKVGRIIEKDNEHITIRHINGKQYKLTLQNFIKFVKKENIAISKANILFSQKTKGILSDLVDQYYTERKSVQRKLKKLKKEYSELDKDDEKLKELQIEIDRLNARQMSIKIFCNSVYGCFGNKYSPIGDDDIASSITLTGQSVIKQSRIIAKEFIKMKTGITDDSLLESHIIAGDTDSLYMSFKNTVSEFSKNGKITKDAYDIVEEFETYLNDEITKWATKTLNSADSRLVFKRENMCDSGMFLKKKRYVLHVLDKEGIKCDEWKYTGVDVVRTTMPKHIKPYVKNIIEKMILTQNESATNEEFRKAYDAFKNLNIYDISLTSGIKNFEKYSSKCNEFITVKGMPCHVKAAYFYNLLLDKLNLSSKYEKIKSGDKIKYFYVETPNKYGIEAIAYKYTYPDEFKDFLKPNVEVMFEKDMYSCIESFYETMKWIPRKPNEQLINNLEDIFS